MEFGRFKSVLVAMAVFSALLFGCSQGPWENFKSEKGGFSIKFPGKPEISTKTENVGPLVQMTSTEHSVNPFLGRFGAKYTVIVSDITAPNMSSLNFDQKQMIEGGKDGIRKQGFEIVAERKIDSSGMEGWEFEVTSSNTDSTLRMFVKGYRIYTLEVARRKGTNFSEEVKKFFESFEMQ